MADEKTTEGGTWDAVATRAEALRAHWNKVKATSGNPGDALIGNMLGALLEAVEAHGKADPFAALHAAEEAVLVARGWKRGACDEEASDWWEHDTNGREAHDCALAIERYHYEQRARLAAKIGGAS